MSRAFFDRARKTIVYARLSLSVHNSSAQLTYTQAVLLNVFHRTPAYAAFYCSNY